MVCIRLDGLALHRHTLQPLNLSQNDAKAAELDTLVAEQVQAPAQCALGGGMHFQGKRGLLQERSKAMR